MKNRSLTALVAVGFVLAVAACQQAPPTSIDETATEAVTSVAAALSVGTGCIEANFTNPPTGGNGTPGPNIFAFLVNTGAAERSMVSLDLFIGARGLPHTADFAIWSRGAGGKPDTRRGGTADLGPTMETHRIAISPTVTLAAETDFFISYDATGLVTNPVAQRARGTRAIFYHSPPTWLGPFGPAPFAYRINCPPEVPQGLQALVENNPGTPMADKLDDAIEYLDKAFEEFGKLPADYQAALGQLEGAVGLLQSAIDDDLLDSDLGTQLMDEIAGVAREFAERALGDARRRRAEPDVIAEAQEYSDEGDMLRGAGLFKDAINKYKDALAKAESAVTVPPPPW